MSQDLRRYRERREKFFHAVAHRWPVTLLDPFDLLDPLPLALTEVAAILDAAAAIARIYRRIGHLLPTLPDEALLQLGVPPDMLELTQMGPTGLSHSVIGRLDLVKTTSGYKMLEFNADAPGFLVETFPINRAVCADAGKRDPNEDAEAALTACLVDAIEARLRRAGRPDGHDPVVVFTAGGRFVRDLDGARYLSGLVEQSGAWRTKVVPSEALSIDGRGLYGPDGQPIDALFRLYLLHYFTRNLAARGEPSKPARGGPQILRRLIDERRLALINPPGAFPLESKALQALIWAFFEARTYFDEEERQLIERFFLPTYLDPPRGEAPYVIKPVYGHYGDTVTIVDPKIGPIFRTDSVTYRDQPPVYQEYVDLPIIDVMTEDGPQPLRVLTSCFLFDGRPAGIGLRAGKLVTDESWWFLPICVAD